MNINELPPEILVNIIRNASEIDPAKGNQVKRILSSVLSKIYFLMQLEKVCWLWKDVIDSHELWKEIAGWKHYCSFSEIRNSNF